MNVYQVSSGMLARADRVINVVFAGLATSLQALPCAARRGIDNNSRSWYLHLSVRFFAACSHRVRHGRKCEPSDLRPVTSTTPAGVDGSAWLFPVLVMEAEAWPEAGTLSTCCKSSTNKKSEQARR